MEGETRNGEPAAGDGASGAFLLLLAAVCGLSVASVYYAQPLLDQIAAGFGVGEGSIGLVVTLTQVGYAIGLLLIVPLGDMVEPRRLILALLSLSVLALLAVAAAPSIAVLLAAVLAVGILAVVIQVIVAFASTLATPGAAGAAVGTVTSGVVIGILLARSFAGAVAELASWRAVYLASSALILLALALLVRRLPATGTRAGVGYGGLLRSLAALYRNHRLLRVRGALALLSFAAFSVVWSSLSLELSAPPYSLSPAAIGAFGLVGAAGALAASRAGRLADRGRGERTTGVALGLMLVSWLALGLLERSLLALAVGLVLLDLGLQATHVTSQTLLYASAPTSTSRMAGAYMFFYSVGSALGAIASTTAFAAGGWIAVCVLGAATSLVALAIWAATRQQPAPEGSPLALRRSAR